MLISSVNIYCSIDQETFKPLRFVKVLESWTEEGTAKALKETMTHCIIIYLVLPYRKNNSLRRNPFRKIFSINVSSYRLAHRNSIKYRPSTSCHACFLLAAAQCLRTSTKPTFCSNCSIKSTPNYHLLFGRSGCNGSSQKNCTQEQISSTNPSRAL